MKTLRRPMLMLFVMMLMLLSIATSAYASADDEAENFAGDAYYYLEYYWSFW
jgi:hypothetical protein